jgi:single-strand DNA-binding protein
MNKAVITGRLGENAEIIDTKNGKIMVKLIVATRDMEETDWHQVKIINEKLAMTCKKCHKGMIVSISGKMKTRKYIDKNNVTHYSTYILADEVIFQSPLNKEG